MKYEFEWSENPADDMPREIYTALVRWCLVDIEECFDVSDRSTAVLAQINDWFIEKDIMDEVYFGPDRIISAPEGVELPPDLHALLVRDLYEEDAHTFTFRACAIDFLLSDWQEMGVSDERMAGHLVRGHGSDVSMVREADFDELAFEHARLHAEEVAPE